MFVMFLNPALLVFHRNQASACFIDNEKFKFDIAVSHDRILTITILVDSNVMD